MRKVFLILFSLIFYSGWIYAAENECVIPDLNDGGIITLNSDCTYRESIVIKKSNMVLDCNGASLDGEGKRTIGILVKGIKLSNIKIKNCKVINFTKTGIMVVSAEKYSVEKSPPHYYSLSPQGITIEKSEVVNSGGVGIVLNAYVNNSSILDSTVYRAKAVGIYLSQSSRNNVISGNILKENGRTGKHLREGLAIDSSAYNFIYNNRFDSNGAGGIFLYKNCGEHADKKLSPIRWQHSDFNKIVNNSFFNEKVGIWIASRQSKNLKTWGCGDPSIDNQGIYYKDYADNNIVEHNNFCRAATGVIIEGDNNSVRYNFFDSHETSWVKEPYQLKTKPDGVTTTGNSYSPNYYKLCSQ